MSETDRLRVVIVDDHVLFRDGLATILAAEADIEVVGQGGSADEAAQLARDLLPEIILLDIDMPGGGLAAARKIAEECPVTRIVMLTASEDDDDLLSALKSGVRAYILKGVAARELLRILRAVAAGESYVPPALAASLLLEMHEPRPRSPARRPAARADRPRARNPRRAGLRFEQQRDRPEAVSIRKDGQALYHQYFAETPGAQPGRSRPAGPAQRKALIVRSRGAREYPARPRTRSACPPTLSPFSSS